MSLEDRLEQQGVIIDFTAHGARLNVEESIDEHASRSIALRLQLERRERILLPDNRRLKDVQWSMYLVETTETVENAEEQKALGTLWHFDESANILGDNFLPESCYINAVLKPANFSALLNAIQTAGRFPFRLSVMVRGLKYSGTLDGSGKVWDVKANPQVPVTKLSFGVRLTALDIDSSSDSEQLEETDQLPASSADIRALQQYLGEHIALLRLLVWKAFIGFAVLALLMWLFLH